MYGNSLCPINSFAIQLNSWKVVCMSFSLQAKASEQDKRSSTGPLGCKDQSTVEVSWKEGDDITNVFWDVLVLHIIFISQFSWALIRGYCTIV